MWTVKNCEELPMNSVELISSSSEFRWTSDELRKIHILISSYHLLLRRGPTGHWPVVLQLANIVKLRKLYIRVHLCLENVKIIDVWSSIRPNLGCNCMPILLYSDLGIRFLTTKFYMELEDQDTACFRLNTRNPKYDFLYFLCYFWPQNPTKTLAHWVDLVFKLYITRSCFRNL